MADAHSRRPGHAPGMATERIGVCRARRSLQHARAGRRCDSGRPGMTLVVHEPFKSLWAGRDAFVEVEKLQGEVFRELEARRTLRTEVNGQGYFVKIHRGVGWREIFKNWSTLKKPVLGADQEWQAIEALTRAGVPTMPAVAYGERGPNPANRHSFIITEELAPTISLEDFSRHWPTDPPAPELKHALIHRVAEMTGRMHRAGVNHR